MGMYRFIYEPSAADRESGTVGVAVAFDDMDGKFPLIYFTVAAFEQFLLGLTFQPGSIAKVLNLETVRQNLEDYRKASE